MRVLSRLISILLGLLSGFAGVVALGYSVDGVATLKFFRANIIGGLVGIAVPGVLCASAFYMAFKLIRKVPPKDTVQ